MQFIRDVPKMAVHTTGGDASNLNGMAKAPRKMTKKTTNALLITAGMLDNFLCFLMYYDFFLIDSSQQSVTKRLPIQQLSGGKQALPPSKVLIWVWKMRVMSHQGQEVEQEAWTGEDPWEVFIYSRLGAPMKLTSNCGISPGVDNNVHVTIC